MHNKVCWWISLRTQSLATKKTTDHVCQMIYVNFVSEMKSLNANTLAQNYFKLLAITVWKCSRVSHLVFGTNFDNHYHSLQI
jgi:hypothetical protein